MIVVDFKQIPQKNRIQSDLNNQTLTNYISVFLFIPVMNQEIINLEV